MYEGQIIVDIFNKETGKITRASKSFDLSFQPCAGMSIDTGLGSYRIDSIEWSLEYNTFCAWIRLVMCENSLDYVNEFEISDWEVNAIDHVPGYEENFIKEHFAPATKFTDCDFCNGTGEGGMRKNMLGSLSQSVCDRCAGLGQIKKSW